MASGSAAADATELASRRRDGDGPVGGALINIAARISGQVITFGSVAILARLLTPGDYGLVAMVLSIAAFFDVFSDLGLTLVTVQRRELSTAQLSTLFWVNVAFGVLLGILTASLAPVLAWFYQDDRLAPLTFALALIFPLGALGVQHQAILKRHMQFRRLAVVKLIGLLVGALTAIAGASAGLGYWALAMQSLSSALTASVAAWFLVSFRPGWPRSCPQLRSMLGFGGSLTLHGLIGYLSRNLDNVLIGKFWGPHALGLYATAYRLMMHPIRLAGHNIGDASIPALSRTAHHPQRMRETFRRMFSLTCLIGLPVCVGCILWADDIVLTLLGAKWVGAIPILRVLFLAAIPRMLTASTGWVYVAGGRPGQMLRWQIIWAPIVAVSFLAGLPFGALGVATAYAAIQWLGIVPWFTYCFHGTSFRATDVLRPLRGPLLCALAACFAAQVCQFLVYGHAEPGPVRLAIRLVVASVAYGVAAVVFVPLAAEVFRKLMEKAGIGAGRSGAAAGVVPIVGSDQADPAVKHATSADNNG